MCVHCWCVHCWCVQLCSDRCKTTANNAFYALQWGVECHCGAADVNPTALGATDCPMDCGGGGGKCGGTYAASTYKYNDPGAGGTPTTEVVPGAEYLGCYKDVEDDRVMTRQDTSTAMTAQVRVHRSCRNIINIGI